MSIKCKKCEQKIEDIQLIEKIISCPHCKTDVTVPEKYLKGLLKAGQELHGFKIVRLIGAGGMGRVYEAIQLSLDRRVALKIIYRDFSLKSQERSKRFLLEIRSI